MKIGIIGMGNMARAVLGGMLKNGMVKEADVTGSAKTKETLDRIRKEFGIAVTLDNGSVAEASDVLILAVKPQFMEEVLLQIKNRLKKDVLLITVAAGKKISWYEERLPGPVKLVRCMPNTPALVGAGCTGVCCNEQVKEEEKVYVLKLMQSFGAADLVPERLMDAVGAVSGSSPAFVFLFLEALGDAGVAAGMTRKQAYEFAAQAVLGSAEMMKKSGLHPGALKDMVCSPGGTTIEGVRVLEESGLRAAVMNAVSACVEKSGKL